MTQMPTHVTKEYIKTTLHLMLLAFSLLLVNTQPSWMQLSKPNISFRDTYFILANLPKSMRTWPTHQIISLSNS